MSPAPPTSGATIVPFPSSVVTAAQAERQLRNDRDPGRRLHRHGAATLSDEELVAVLTRTRVRREADLHTARALLRDGLGPLLQRVAAGTADIPRQDGTRLAALLELTRRATLTAVDDRARFHVDLHGSRLVARYALDVQERLGVLLLDTRERVITEREVYVGTLHMATVSTRDVVRLALDLHAHSVVLFHNHPSGDPQPSDDDVAYTRRLSSAAKLLDIEVRDHLVLGRSRYVSMKRNEHF
ncbi:MAG: JAB domain-containing protein [Acidobacteriota bacterium]